MYNFLPFYIINGIIIRRVNMQIELDNKIFDVYITRKNINQLFYT